MRAEVIKTEAEHEAALVRLDELLDASQEPLRVRNSSFRLRLSRSMRIGNFPRIVRMVPRLVL